MAQTTPALAAPGSLRIVDLAEYVWPLASVTLDMELTPLVPALSAAMQTTTKSYCDQVAPELKANEAEELAELPDPALETVKAIGACYSLLS